MSLQAGEGGRIERVRVRGDVGGRGGEGRERQVRVRGEEGEGGTERQARREGWRE